MTLLQELQNTLGNLSTADDMIYAELEQDLLEDVEHPETRDILRPMVKSLADAYAALRPRLEAKIEELENVHNSDNE